MNLFSDTLQVQKIFSKSSQFLAKLSERNLFWFLALTGILSAVFFRSLLAALPYQFGIEAAGLFVPPFLASLYMAICGSRRGFTNGLLLKTVALFCIQLIPFGHLLIAVVLPNPGEDFARNFAYAQNMIAHNTLWGGDKIAYPDEGNAFITQPGQRYFIALELIMFKHLYRFVSVFNALIFVVSLFYFMKAVYVSLEKSLFRSVLLFFLVLTVPYAVKNIMMGLNEWLMITFLMLSVYFTRVRNAVIAALVFLALVPFIRQNSLPSVLLIACWIILNCDKKLFAAILFLLVLLLPVYHNLYYAGEWRYFASIHQWPFLSYATPSKYEPSIGINYMKVINNVLHYTGIHIRANNSIDIMEESLGFLWLFPFVYYFMQKKYFTGWFRLFFLTITLAMILPTFFIATHFYPRFEFVCIFWVLAAFVFLVNQTNRFPSMKGIGK